MSAARVDEAEKQMVAPIGQDLEGAETKTKTLRLVRPGRLKLLVPQSFKSSITTARSSSNFYHNILLQLHFSTRYSWLHLGSWPV
jgi:hypothetical protein